MIQPEDNRIFGYRKIGFRCRADRKSVRVYAMRAERWSRQAIWLQRNQIPHGKEESPYPQNGRQRGVLAIVDAHTAVFCNPLYAGEEGLHGNHAYLHNH